MQTKTAVQVLFLGALIGIGINLAKASDSDNNLLEATSTRHFECNYAAHSRYASSNGSTLKQLAKSCIATATGVDVKQVKLAAVGNGIFVGSVVMSSSTLPVIVTESADIGVML